MAGKTLTLIKNCRVDGKLRSVGEKLTGVTDKDLSGNLKPLVDAECFAELLPQPEIAEPDITE